MSISLFCHPRARASSKSVVLLFINTRSPVSSTAKPPIKDTLIEDKPPNKGQVESAHVYTLYRKSPLEEDNLELSTKSKTALVPKVSL